MTVSRISSFAIASLLVFGTSLALAGEATQASLQAQAKISEADARTTALAKVPGGSVSSSELEKEHGKLVWSFDIAQTGSKNITEVQVDANTGKVVSTKTETPAQEHKEAMAEKPKSWRPAWGATAR
jgi:Peptidase propeptide and YPEB domain